MLKLVCVILLSASVLGNILQLDRWPILEGIAREQVEALFVQLKSATFPTYSHEFSGFIIPNIMTIYNFKITNISPRFAFMRPTFYSSPDERTFTITLPLGFHITTEFLWFYNWFILPVSGKGAFHTDIHEFAYNTTFEFSKTGNITVKSNLDYEIINPKEITTENWLGFDNFIGASSLLVSMIDKYYPNIKSSIKLAMSTVLPNHFGNHIKKQIEASLYYPTFHLVYNFILPITDITTRNSLMMVYGTSHELPSSLSVPSNVARQYCLDEGLLNTVISGVWPRMKGVYRKGDLPNDAIYKLTVKGFGQLVPDVLIEYAENDVATLLLSKAKDLPTITLEKINDTLGVAKGFTMKLTFNVKEDSIMAVEVGFDITVSPNAIRRNQGYSFNLQTVEATVNSDKVKIVSLKEGYSTVISSNIVAATKEYLNYLILPFMGHTLLGDGLVISDDITASSTAQYTVTKAAICMDLVKIL